MTLPAIPDTFRWTVEPWGYGLRCLPLESVATHVFTTRQLQLSSPSDLQALAAAVGAVRVEMLKQVHGREVVVRHSNSQPPTPNPQTPEPWELGIGSWALGEGDALVSDDPGVAVVVRAADCVPLLMADRVRGVVAAVHAGWRGTAARVAVAALETMTREFGTRPADVVAAIGPSIGACCYEVGPELVDAFAAAGHERYLISRWFQAPPPERGRFGAPAPRLRLDVAGANRDQLVLAGVNEADVHMAGLCTAMHLDLLTSYRAEKDQAGRIAGVIRRRSGAA
jgi:YfiH family protein